MPVTLLRFELQAASRTVGGARFRRGEGPTVPADSPTALQLLGDPSWTSREIRGSVAPDRAPPADVPVSVRATNTYDHLRATLAGVAERVATLSPVELAEYAVLVASALREGDLMAAIDAALCRGETEKLLRADDELGLDLAPAREQFDANGLAPLEPGDLEPTIADPFVPAHAPPPAPAPAAAPAVPSDVTPLADEAVSALREALASSPIPTAKRLVEMAVAAGYPSADDAAGWQKGRLVTELTAWIDSLAA